MKKIITFLLSLTVTAFSLLAGAGCTDSFSNGREIDKVLLETKRILNSLPPSERGKSAARKEYRDWFGYATRQMRAIDTSRCPQDFRYAFESYVRANEDEYRERCKLAGEAGLLKQISSNMIPGGLTRAYYDQKEAIENINIISERHGAKQRLTPLPSLK